MSNPKLQKIRVCTDGAFTKVFIDDKQIKNVQSIKFTHDVDGLALMKIEVLALEACLEDECYVSCLTPEENKSETIK